MPLGSEGTQCISPAYRWPIRGFAEQQPDCVRDDLLVVLGLCASTIQDAYNAVRAEPPEAPTCTLEGRKPSLDGETRAVSYLKWSTEAILRFGNRGAGAECAHNKTKHEEPICMEVMGDASLTNPTCPADSRCGWREPRRYRRRLPPCGLRSPIAPRDGAASVRRLAGRATGQAWCGAEA